MTTAATRNGMGWGARLLVALTLLLVGAGTAVWALARSERAAQLLGVAPAPPPQRIVAKVPENDRPQTSVAAEPAPQTEQRVTTLEQRLARLENATQRVEGSAGRADALLVAFAARRAVERGVALGYLEPLLVDRFGSTNPRAVAVVVTSARQPVMLGELVNEYDQLGPQLRAGGPQDSFWTSFKRELGELIEIRRADRPSMKPDARYARAQDFLRAGEVDSALAETMRLPGAAHAEAWTVKARRYVALQNALDEIESAALLSRSAPRS